MPLPSRILIRSSLIYLIFGFLLGGILLLNKAYSFHPMIWAVLPIHIEMLIFGWIIQFTLGTAYWILPRYLNRLPGGSTKFVWLMILLFNLGIWLNIIDLLIGNRIPLALIGRVFEMGAVMLFILLHWRRVISYKNVSHG